MVTQHRTTCYRQGMAEREPTPIELLIGGIHQTVKAAYDLRAQAAPGVCLVCRGEAAKDNRLCDSCSGKATAVGQKLVGRAAAAVATEAAGEFVSDFVTGLFSSKKTT